MIRFSVAKRLATAALAAFVFVAPATAHHGAAEDWDQCRAVALVHLSQADWANAAVPESATIALLEQMGFVMVEGVFGSVSESMDDLSDRLIYAEKYFLDQRLRVAEAAQAYPTTADRDRLLMFCFGFVWTSVKREIDVLMTWRKLGIDAPERTVWPPGLRDDE